MQEPLRIICIEHRRAEHGITAQILTDSHLEFGWKCVSSPRALSGVTTEFNPHIVLCTDELTRTSGHALLDALRLLCSQTPVILVSSLYSMDTSVARAFEPPVLTEKPGQSPLALAHSSERALLRNAPDAADLRAAFSAILESSVTAAVMTDAEGSVTHANTRACEQLSGSCQRTLVTLLGEAHDQCPAMPHWLPVSPDAGQHRAYSGVEAKVPKASDSERGRHRLAYIDEWSFIPTLVHMDDLIGCGTASKREDREALAVIAVDPGSGRIPGEAFGQDSEVARDACGIIDAPTNTLRCGSIVRIAIDDFLVVLPDPTRAADAASTVRRLLDTIAEDRLGAESAGRSAPAAAPAMESKLDPSILGCQSNTGMRESTSTRHRGPPVHKAELTQIGAELNDAVQRRALNVMYQPQFDLKTGRGCGIEALARWTLASGDVIAPSVFIPIAEREGIIHALGA